MVLLEISIMLITVLGSAPLVCLRFFAYGLSQSYPMGQLCEYLRIFLSQYTENKFAWGYDDKWSEIHDQYKSMIRASACVSKSINFNAVLVCLGTVLSNK